MCNLVNCDARGQENIVDHMATATPEQPVWTEQDLDISTGYEQQFLDILGPTAGPEAYLRMTALLDNSPDQAHYFKRAVRSG